MPLVLQSETLATAEVVPPRDHFSRAVIDILEGAGLWRLWATLGWNDILQRYRRSLLGPFWLTASTAILIIALGFVYSELFKTPIDEFLPYLTVSLLIWNYASSFLVESATLFVGSESYIKQIRLPYSVYVFRSTWSKLIIFLHNSVMYFFVMLYFGVWPGWIGLLFFVGFFLLTLNVSLLGLALGMISARFRDVPPLVNSLVQLIFFVTPIMWSPSLLQSKSYIATFNPAFHFIEIARAPLLGSVPAALSYWAVLGITLLTLVSVGMFFARFRSRISFWV